MLILVVVVLREGEVDIEFDKEDDEDGTTTGVEDGLVELVDEIKLFMTVRDS